MEYLWEGLILLGGLGLIADILSKGIGGLYARHRALLIRPLNFGNARWRFGALYFAMAIMGALLLLKGFTAAMFTVNWLLSLMVIVVIVTDYEQQLIFDRVLLALALTALVFSPVMDAAILDRLMAAAVGGGVMFLLAMAPGGMIGGGDIKLLFVLGLWQGTAQLLSIFIVGFLGGGIAALFLLLFRGKKRRDLFAYGPYFAMGALLNLFL